MIITTSWDDGHPLDMKLAELLDKYNISATFYIPCKNGVHKVVENSDLINLNRRFEIGGHTVNHIFLNTLKKHEAKDEIFNCKSILQEILGEEINAFCFPGGKYSNRDIDLVKNAGFLFGRTTDLFHTSIDLNQTIMNTSIQTYNHKFNTLLKHCLKRTFILPIIKYNSFIPHHRNYRKLAQLVLEETSKTNGIFHLWGHSWEIEKYDLWFEIEETLKMLKDENEAIFLNNSECWNYIRNKII